MSWVKLDDAFHANPKVLAMGLEGAGLYARALSYCGHYLTDGFVPFRWAWSVASEGNVDNSDPEGLLDLMGEVGAFVYVEGPPEGFQIPDYLRFNPSRKDVEEERHRKSQGGRKGANKRWNSSSHNSTHGISDGLSDSTSHSSAHAEAIGTRDAPVPRPQPEVREIASSDLSLTIDKPKLATPQPPTPLEATSAAESPLPIAAECPVCGPLHTVPVGFNLAEHVEHVHGLELEQVLASRSEEVEKVRREWAEAS